MQEVFNFGFSGTAKDYLAKFHPSIAAVVPCKTCEGKGWFFIANGEDDYDKEVCYACDGSGKVIVDK